MSACVVSNPCLGLWLKGSEGTVEFLWQGERHLESNKASDLVTFPFTFCDFPEMQLALAGSVYLLVTLGKPGSLNTNIKFCWCSWGMFCSLLNNSCKKPGCLKYTPGDRMKCQTYWFSCAAVILRVEKTSKPISSFPLSQTLKNIPYSSRNFPCSLQTKFSFNFTNENTLLCSCSAYI